MSLLDPAGGTPGAAALILKFGQYRLHHGGLAMIRTLGRLGVPVFATYEDTLTPSALSRFLSGGFCQPILRSSGDFRKPSPAELGEALTVIVDRIGRPTVVFATDDQAAIALDEARPVLPETVLVPHAPAGLYPKIVDKLICHSLVADAGLPVPKQIVLECPIHHAQIASVPLPSVLKRARRELLSTGTRTFSTVVVHGLDEVEQTLRDRHTGPYTVLVQEWFPGEDWLYHGYYDKESRPLLSFTARKLRSRPAGAGETAAAISTVDHEVREVAETLLRFLKFVGPVSMDLRRDDRDGSLKVLDVNPRVGACFRAFTSASGMDVVRAMYLDLAGYEIPDRSQIPGRTYVVENYDREVRRAYGLTRRASLREALRSDELAWLDPSDPLPAAALLPQMLLGMKRRRQSAQREPLHFRRGRRR